MGTFLLTLGKGILGYVAGKLVKPEVAIELILDLADVIAERTDTELDDKGVALIRKALGHEED